MKNGIAFIGFISFSQIIACGEYFRPDGPQPIGGTEATSSDDNSISSFAEACRVVVEKYEACTPQAQLSSVNASTLCDDTTFESWAAQESSACFEAYRDWTRCFDQSSCLDMVLACQEEANAYASTCAAGSAPSTPPGNEPGEGPTPPEQDPEQAICPQGAVTACADGIAYGCDNGVAFAPMNCSAAGESCGATECSVNGQNVSLSLCLGCNDVPYEGLCRGTTMAWCDSSCDTPVHLEYNCADEGLICSINESGAAGCIDQEDTEPSEPQGQCTDNSNACGENNILSMCANGVEVQQIDCGAYGSECGMVTCGAQSGAVCRGCGDVTMTGECDEGTVRFCEPLQCDEPFLMEIDCASAGAACGWNNDANFYDCVPMEASCQEEGESCGDSSECCQDSCIDGVCSCIPECLDKSCGGDGCGGSCGGCASEETCEGGECLCIPDCPWNSCGSDGCGGSCGNCGGADVCSGGQCLCIPQCDEKSCGSNGCGGSCGSCDANENCESGSCIVNPNYCDPITDTGCSFGQGCYVVLNEEIGCAATIGGGGGTGASCTSSNDCWGGYGCFANKCQKFCRSGNDDDCSFGDVCYPVSGWLQYGVCDDAP